MNPKVDFYFAREGSYATAIAELRKIVLGCGLTEELKWGCPCYTHEGRNIVLIHVFKNYCALLFFKGVLLQNEEGLLVQQTDKVQAARQARFTSLQEVRDHKDAIRRTIFEAIEVERSGIAVPLKKTEAYAVPEEFQARLAEDPLLREAFEALTPGRQRAYLLHFAGAKQSKTRAARVEKCRPAILMGKGLDD